MVNGMTRPVLALALATVLLGGAPSASQPTALERAFAPGGIIRLDLTPGAYHVVGRPGDAIRMSWHTQKPGMLDRIRGEIEIRPGRAVITTSAPHNSSATFEIEVPERSNLEVDLPAGDLSVRGVEGDKNLSMWAGDVTIEVGKTELYRRVYASVRFGDISAPPFNRTTGGIFRSRAKLFAGDLKLR
jgi:hypothetical protein